MQGESGEQRRGAGVGMKAVGQGAPPPEQQEQLPCPRCDSTSTKFCYYNNYNLSQPRHFCKSCRRYWTQGGTLRDIPVGGATRKSAKRCRTLPPQAPPPPPPQPPSSVSNSFTSLLTSSTPPLLALGGLGLSIPTSSFDDPSFGPFGRALWAFPEVGYFGNGSVGDAGGINMWHLDTSPDQPAPPAGYVAPDCFSSWPELAISTPGNALK